jgi:hypothetical protein
MFYSKTTTDAIYGQHMGIKFYQDPEFCGLADKKPQSHLTETKKLTRLSCGYNAPLGLGTIRSALENKDQQH